MQLDVTGGGDGQVIGGTRGRGPAVKADLTDQQLELGEIRCDRFRYRSKGRLAFRFGYQLDDPFSGMVRLITFGKFLDLLHDLGRRTLLN